MTDRRAVLVTGSTDGIGRATARALAAGGMKVILHGRTKPRVDTALAALAAELPGAELEGVSFDLGSLAAVRRGAEQILARVPALHVLINNAGIFADERVITEDGIELTFAVNHVGPFLLTELLAPRLAASALGAPSRVINVASIAHTRGRIHLDDLTLANGWTGYAAYAMSKLANVMHAMSLAEQHAADRRSRVAGGGDPDGSAGGSPSGGAILPRGIDRLVAYSLHPGVVSTKLLRQGFGPVAGVAAEVGARSSVRLAGEDEVTAPSGSYFNDGVQAQPAATARDAAVRAALWDASRRLAKL